MKTLATLAACLLAAACGIVTSWDATGLWNGQVSRSGAMTAQRESAVTDVIPGSSESRVDACDLRELAFSLSFIPFEQGNPAAIEVRLATPLCQLGSSPVEGGSVLVWQPMASDSTTVSARPSDQWTVSGTLTVTSFSDLGLPDLDVGESATVQEARGTFELTARETLGDSIRVESAEFQLTVEARKFKRSIS